MMVEFRGSRSPGSVHQLLSFCQYLWEQDGQESELQLLRKGSNTTFLWVGQSNCPKQPIRYPVVSAFLVPSKSNYYAMAYHNHLHGFLMFMRWDESLPGTLKNSLQASELCLAAT